MAYIVGAVRKEELEELKRRGWEAEDCPAELISSDLINDGLQYVMFYVDRNVFEIMDDEGWEDAGLNSENREVLAELVKRLEKQSKDDTNVDMELDYEVHDISAKRASEVNNQGYREQLRFLLKQGGVRYVKDLIQSMLEDRKK